MNTIYNKVKHFTLRSILLTLPLGGVGGGLLTSCSDYFSPTTDDQIAEDDYISSNTELYTGFIGIMTKLQAIGDKEILLTDTRAEMLEPTSNASTELVNIYDYADNLKGNSYASPAPYYEVIIACNDYLNKVKEYRSQPQVDTEICDNLISSTIRIKVWTYKTIGEIYGEAAWTDSTIGSVDDYLAQCRDSIMPMNMIVDRCLDLMQNGYMGVAANRVIDWIAWLDPDNVTNIASSSFRKWNYMVPAYEGILAELCLWKGAYLDADGDNTQAKTYYKIAADQLLSALNTYINNENYSGSKPYWIPNANNPGDRQRLWWAQEPYVGENVCALLYDYTNNQTNSLVKHFNSDSPAEYLLCPSDSGCANFTDPAKNPGGSTSTTRYKYTAKYISGSTGSKYMCKFRQNLGNGGIRSNAYQDDVQIYIYRSTQYHLMLAEALNNLERFTACGCVLNTGINGANMTELVDSTNVKEWEGFTRNWTSDAEWGTRKYPGLGIRGCFGLSARTIETKEDVPVKKAILDNDIQILRESELEFSCEGKTYPWMNRMAVRHKDLNIVANEVCPKYVPKGKDAAVRAKILAGGNWVNYPL